MKLANRKIDIFTVDNYAISVTVFFFFCFQKEKGNNYTILMQLAHYHKIIKLRHSC